MQNACATTTATIRHGGPCEDGYITVGNVVVPIIDRKAVDASTQTVQNACRRANNVFERGRMTRADAVDATTHSRRGSAASRDTVRVTVAIADSHSTRGSAASRDTVRVPITVADSHSTRGSSASRDTVRVTFTVADSHSTRGSAASRDTVRVTITVADSHSTRGSAASRDTVRVTIYVAEHPATAMPLAVRGGRRVERHSPLSRDEPRNPIWVCARVCMTASTHIITASDRYRRRRLRRVRAVHATSVAQARSTQQTHEDFSRRPKKVERRRTLGGDSVCAVHMVRGE